METGRNTKHAHAHAAFDTIGSTLKARRGERIAQAGYGRTMARPTVMESRHHGGRWAMPFMSVNCARTPYRMICMDGRWDVHTPPPFLSLFLLDGGKGNSVHLCEEQVRCHPTLSADDPNCNVVNGRRELGEPVLFSWKAIAFHSLAQRQRSRRYNTVRSAYLVLLSISITLTSSFSITFHSPHLARPQHRYRRHVTVFMFGSQPTKGESVRGVSLFYCST